MAQTTVTIPSAQVQEMTCASCQAVARYHVVKDQWPHLYCTYCHNAYVELGNHLTLKKIRTDSGAKKAQQIIEGEAQLCRCGGMFLFDVRVHCVHCGEALPFTFPAEALDRLRHSDLVMFDGSIARFDDGKTKLFRLSA